MSLREPRCMVCGGRLDQGAIFSKDIRTSEVCSDECYEIYMDNGKREGCDKTVMTTVTHKEIQKAIQEHGIGFAVGENTMTANTFFKKPRRRSDDN